MARTFIGIEYRQSDPETSQGNCQPKILAVPNEYGYWNELGELNYTITGNYQSEWCYPVAAFGPCYGSEYLNSRIKLKEAVWEHVVKRELSLHEAVSIKVEGEAASQRGERSPSPQKTYYDAIHKVVGEARGHYYDLSDPSITIPTEDEFIWMMIKDGCLMLQVALFVLGGSNQLDYKSDHRTFGQLANKEQMRTAVSSMFIPGNQLPLVVLKELMKQSFFRSVICRGKWQESMDLERRILFELLVVPTVGTHTKITPSIFHGLCGHLKGSGNRSHIEANDILHGLRRLLWTGLTRNTKKDDTDEDDDNDHYDGAIPIVRDILHGLRKLWAGLTRNTKKDDTNKDDDDDHYAGAIPIVRSATELKEVGIYFKDNNETGIRGIRLQRNWCRSFFSYFFVTIDADLMLPRIVIDSETNILFRSLIHYEITQKFGLKQRKICAYFQLMRELIRSPDDARLLATHGIIVTDDPKQEEGLPELFKELPLPKIKNVRNLSHVRNQLRNYTQPSKWKELRNLLSIVLVLTVVQTVYTTLSYHRNC